MKLLRLFMVAVAFMGMTAFAEFFENLGNAVTDVGRAAGDVVAAPGRIIEGGVINKKSGVITEGEWQGRSIEFNRVGDRAYIGGNGAMDTNAVKIVILNCVVPGGVSTEQYVQGQEFLTYREKATGHIFTCKYIKVR